MRKNKISENVSNWSYWFGLALFGTAALILIANPNIVIFMTPYTGNKIQLIRLLALFGIQFSSVGLLTRKSD